MSLHWICRHIGGCLRVGLDGVSITVAISMCAIGNKVAGSACVINIKVACSVWGSWSLIVARYLRNW